MALGEGMNNNQETIAFRETAEPINLKDGLSREQLGRQLAFCDDRAGSHVLWVDTAGGVHLDRVPPRLPPTNWAKTLGEKMKFRYSAFLAGRNRVGRKACEDEAWVEALLENLHRDWERDARGCVELRLKAQPVERIQPIAA